MLDSSGEITHAAGVCSALRRLPRRDLHPLEKNGKMRTISVHIVTTHCVWILRPGFGRALLLAGLRRSDNQRRGRRKKGGLCRRSEAQPR